MVTQDELEARQAELSGDLAALRDALAAKARPLMVRMPVVPKVKALLSADGGTCPACRSQLAFDPWSPTEHRCPQCGAIATGERHDRHWARAQHLWLAERAAHLAVTAAFTEDEAMAARATEILRAYYDLYFELPNRDNVLGPSHLFFSTYLESIWLLNYLAAAFVLREKGWLEEADIEAVNLVVDEAARLIGEFDEGMSNRQTWNAAALTAIGVWFDDEDLLQVAIEGRTGLLGHLTEGFGDDGMWAEGENYHLFAMRGLLLGLEWAHLGGADIWSDPALAALLGRALMAPARTALPDFTFPARKDSRFGISLAQPAYLECWEVGLARLGATAPAELGSWLAALYQRPERPGQTYDAYLHDAGEPLRAATGRTDLSWWMLLTMTPELPAAPPYQGSSTLLPNQGVAVLRHGDRYVGLECGEFGGGHGHPDRLNLTVHAAGVHWLADPGTGSYVHGDLRWYRSSLAHNAPRLEGRSQEPGDARPITFEARGDWGWAAAEFGPVRRTVVSGPDWLLDVIEVEPGSVKMLELPWHLDGDVSVVTAGAWSPAQSADEFVSDVEAFAPEGGADVVLEARRGDAVVRLHLVGGTVVRATGPGRPGAGRRPFHLVRVSPTIRLVAVLDFSGAVTAVNAGSERIEVVSGSATTAVRLASAAVAIQGPGVNVSLGGAVPAAPPPKPFLADRPIRFEGQAFHIVQPPALDGSLDGFDTEAPLELADEGHYFRSEEAYDDPERFSAVGYVNWDHDNLYVAVEVTKPQVIVRGPGAPPLDLDNDPEDIHSDGIQVYARIGDAGEPQAFLIRPAAGGGLLARPIPGSPDHLAELAGGSAIRDDGYTITVAIPMPELARLGRNATVHFDLLVNEMRPGRVRRAGQLAWGGGSGWIYLRSDQRDPSRWGVLELLG